MQTMGMEVKRPAPATVAENLQAAGADFARENLRGLVECLIREEMAEGRLFEAAVGGVAKTLRDAARACEPTLFDNTDAILHAAFARSSLDRAADEAGETFATATDGLVNAVHEVVSASAEDRNLPLD